MSVALTRLFAVASVVLAIAGCPDPTPQVIDTPELKKCENDDQCSTGQLCVAGDCRLAQCNPAVESVCGVDNLDNRDPTCCKVFQNCNPIALTCERDPNAVGIGCPPGEEGCTPCSENLDCVETFGFQSFCSAGRCFEQANRTACTQDFQCADGERCDRTEFFCTPDAQACRFCGPDFPELCCETGQVCDTGSGACLDLGDIECTVETVVQDCRIGELCDDLGRCVQCIDTERDCGPNTECNPGTGLCDGTIGQCEVDNDCNDPFFCVAGRCAIPDCTADRDCDDRRELCQDFFCVLPAAVCVEEDEPNNSPDAAIELGAVGAGYGGLLCRGDQDFLSFPVQPQKRYVVTVTIVAGNTPFNGVALTLTDTAGAVESSATYAGTATLPLVGVTGPAETGRFVLAVNSGGSIARDQWSYTVSIREEDASAEADCSAAAQVGQEPNDDFASAIVLDNGVARTFTRCGTGDVDVFQIAVPELHGVEFTVDGFQNAEGNMNVELFRGPSNGDLVVRAQTTANTEVVAAPEGSTTYFARVVLGSATGALTNQIFRVTARAVPRPAACDTDVGENDGSIATAPVLTTTVDGEGLVTGSVSALRCNAQDTDLTQFTVPASQGGTLRVTFTNSEGDLALDLLNPAGVQVATSNSSSAANGSEAIDLPQSVAEQTFFARVRLASTNGPPILGQRYTLTLSTFDAGACLVSEPSPDNTFVTARCVGAFAEGTTVCNGDRLPASLAGDLVACQADETAPGCFLTCGNGDVDTYRIGSLEAGRTVSVTLTFDPALGALGVQAGKLSSATGTVLSIVSSASDTDGNGVVTLDLLTSGAAREHGIIIRPEGTSGHEAQVYALTLNVSAACTPDDNEVGVGNATPGTATRQRPKPQALQADEVIPASLCTGDVDVYEIFGLANEALVARVEGLPGARLRVGTRPANLANPAVTIADGEAIADADGIAEVAFTSTRVQQLYFTIDRSGTDAATGDYTLTLDFGAP